MAFGDMSKYFIREVSGFTLGFEAQILMRLQMILSLSERFIELMETLWTQMLLKEWLWVNPNHFYIWQQIKSLLSNGALTETFSLEIRILISTPPRLSVSVN